MDFKKINISVGWFAFLVAAVTYLLTIEPTASFWDCGEFITTSYKLEVGHPPGAPLFMIIGRFFSLFAGGDVTKVALMINVASALASAFTILFLFWSITHIAKKIIIKKDEQASQGQLIAIMGSGLVGALVYTFSDSFWFSAVEGEVYASSSFFTAIVFWAILKWENVADEPNANRWLVLIAYLMGLSIGVHLLNLLVIPAIVFVYYFRKYKITRNGIIITGLISVVILGFIMYGIITGLVVVASKFELIFTNSFGLPYYTGAVVFLLLLTGGLIYGIYYSFTKNKVVLNTILTISLVILIGYSSFAIILIRSLADTPMNQNAPNNVFSLLSYLNREQYGDRPLFNGQSFNAKVTDYEQGKASYYQEDGKYKISEYQTKRIFDSKYLSLFPRMYSDAESPNHIEGYLKWTGKTEKDFYNPRTDKDGKIIKDRYGDLQYDHRSPKRAPTLGEQLHFFFSYQLNYMYFRYFMWNFSGKQNDIQGHNADVSKGNWISGIPFIDNVRLGDQSKITTAMKNNKARNKYYLLPFLLGIIGMIYLLTKNKTSKNYFWAVLLFFFFTGVAIVLYLNQPPYQPRERDYAYAGSFYAFAFFIGLGILGIFELIKKISPQTLVAAGTATILGLLVPIIMAQQNWDDHSRANRYTTRDYAKNYLSSCEKNAIIFTNGDNDTFPLWYIQEVEGFRTDVRVINLSYLNTDWYIDGNKKKAYLSEPVPFSLTHDKYREGKRDIIYKQENPNLYIDEKYYAQTYKFEKEYKPIFDNFFKLLKNSGFEEKFKKNYDAISSGHKTISPTRFYSLTKNINDPKILSQLELSKDSVEKYSKKAENFLIKLSAEALPLKSLLKHISQDDQAFKISVGDNEFANYIPTSRFFIPAPKEQIKKYNVVQKEDFDKIIPGIDWDIKKNYIRKNELMILDLLATNNWKRPVYFAITVGGSSYMNLEDYFQLEGLSFKVVPIKNTGSNSYADRGRVNTDILYDNMMNKFKWGGLDSIPDKIYLDENNRRFLLNFKSTFIRLAEELTKENKKDKAKKVLDRCTGLFTNDMSPYGYYDALISDQYYKTGDTINGKKIMQIVVNNSIEKIEYYLSLKIEHRLTILDDLEATISWFRGSVQILKANKQNDFANECLTKFLNVIENKYQRYNLPAKINLLQSDEDRFYLWYSTLPEYDKAVISYYLQLLMQT